MLNKDDILVAVELMLDDAIKPERERVRTPRLIPYPASTG